jgi:hypothetical protein
MGIGEADTSFYRTPQVKKITLEHIFAGKSAISRYVPPDSRPLTQLTPMLYVVGTALDEAHNINKHRKVLV